MTIKTADDARLLVQKAIENNQQKLAEEAQQKLNLLNQQKEVLSTCINETINSILNEIEYCAQNRQESLTFISNNKMRELFQILVSNNYHISPLDEAISWFLFRICSILEEKGFKVLAENNLCVYTELNELMTPDRLTIKWN